MRKLVFWIFLALTALPAAAFERDVWQSPGITEVADATELVIEQPPSGLFLRKALEADKRYLLTVRGSGGPLTMRLQLDDKPHEYLAAPKGETTRVVTGAEHIELLFYADAPASYRLEAANIEECPACRTSADVRARIVAEAPRIATAKGLDKAIAILEWAANTGDYSPDSKLIPADFESWPVEKMLYDMFDKDRGGVSCGGYSVFLQKTLNLFGIDAFTINYGVPDSYVTHVTVVVPAGNEFHLLDPSFAVTYQRRGRPLALAEALDRLARRDGVGEIGFLEIGLPRRDFIGVPGTNNHRLNKICVPEKAAGGGLTKCRIGKHSYFASFAAAQSQSWEAAGVPLDRLALLRLMFKGVFSVGPTVDPSVRERFMAMLRTRGIPFHKS